MTRRLVVNGVGLHVEDDGDGPAVLLLHGWPDSSRLWRHQVPALGTAGFRTVRRGRGVDQREKYWFHLLFPFEGTAEQLLTADDWALFHELTRRGGDNAQHVADLSRPGALSASLSLYRANAAPAPPAGEAEPGPVHAPTLVVWPDRDPFVVGARLQASTSFVDGPFQLVRLRGAGHWAPVEAPDAVDDLLLRWLPSGQEAPGDAEVRGRAPAERHPDVHVVDEVRP